VQAEEPVPDAGLRAEMAQRWEEAIRVYEGVLREQPQRADLWVRISDIQARQGRPQDAVLSLLKAIDLRPDDAALYFKLSQAHAANSQPQAALSACNRALELAPENIEYLRARAQLANWAGEDELARQTYQEILRLVPADAEAKVGLARSRAWSGALDQAAADYRAYLAEHPQEAQMWVEYARVEMWRGDSAAAEAALGRYRELSGADQEYLGQRARLLAWAGRPTEALAIVEPLLAAAPDDYELNYTRTVALGNGRRPREAVESLAVLERLRPGSEDTREIGRIVRTPLRSGATLGFGYSDDSDDVRIMDTTLEATLVLSPETRLHAGGLYQQLRGRTGDGLDTVDGDGQIKDGRLWLGADHRFNPAVALDGRFGYGEIEGENDFWLYRLGLELHPRDTVRLRLLRERDLFAVSARAVSVGVKRNANRLQLQWQPDLRWFVEATGDWSTFSDDNRRWELVLAPRRAVLRTERFNLDLGVATWWFGFDKDLDHGYYDPGTYQRHALTGFGYWKLGTDDGIGVMVGLGVQKDEDMSGYRFGEDVAVEGVFGLYRDWMLRFSLGWADRDLQGGSYDGLSGHAALTRRF
jgi:tetratricopeptide (TPR) repeat protein